LASFLFFGAMILAGIVPVARASVLVSEEVFKDKKELSDWICHYYQHQEAGLLEAAVRALSEFKLIGSGYAEKDSFAVGFLSEIFAQNPDRVADWLRETGDLPYPGPKAVVWTAAVSSDSLQAKEAMQKIADASDPPVRSFIRSLLLFPAYDFLKNPVLYPEFVDIMWGKFFATGDARYVAKIISALGLADQTTAWDNKAMAAREAELYLVVYAGKYPEVMSLCEEELPRQPENVKKRLQTVLSGAKRIQFLFKKFGNHSL
jgi:hypothetical protein